MLQRFTIAIVATAVLWCATDRAGAQPADLKARIQRQAKPLVDAGAAVGMVVGVVKDGETLVLSFGEVEKGSGKAPQSNTVYEIGSVTKLFTGILLADAVARGEMALDDPLTTHLPRRLHVPTFEDQPIRLVHLATHTSGLPRLPDNMPYSDPLNPYFDYDAQRLYAFLHQHELVEPPGTQWEYSNLGAGLLGHILARKAGRTYEELAKERICLPLQMNDTVVALTPEQQSRLAPPYNQGLDPDKNWEFDVLAGAGALRSTCDDMLKFIQAHFREDDSPLSKAMQAAREIHYQSAGSPHMGLGWLRAADGITYMHAGGTGGYHSDVAISPSHKLGAIVLANTAVEALDVVAEKIIQTVYGMDVEPYVPAEQPEEVVVGPDILEEYVGYYRLTPAFGINVTLEAGQLTIQATGQPKVPVFASTETEFFLKVVEAQITFVRADDGTVEKLILHQAGQHLEGLREAPKSALPVEPAR